jgi:hypothetical protein
MSPRVKFHDWPSFTVAAIHRRRQFCSQLCVFVNSFECAVSPCAVCAFVADIIDRSIYICIDIYIYIASVQAQRVGKEPPDAQTTFRSVWRWKQPAYTNVCPTYKRSLDGERAQAMHIDHYAGYFQAGSASLHHILDCILLTSLQSQMRCTSVLWPAYALVSRQTHSMGYSYQDNIVTLISNSCKSARL